MPPRKRSFSGCWTCRARKIKCGLEKPVCVRCVRANLTCAGYGIKLRWAKPLAICEDTNALINATDGVDEESSQRRNVEFVVFPPDQVYRMFSEVDEVLAATTDVVWTDVPSRSDGTKWYRAGPFGVLNMNPLKRRNDEVLFKKPKVPKRATEETRDSQTEFDSQSGPRGYGSRVLPHPVPNSPHSTFLNHLMSPSAIYTHIVTNPEVSLPPQSFNAFSTPASSLSNRIEFDSDSDGNIEDESNKSSAWIHRDVVASAELTVKAMMGLNYEFNPATSDPQVYFIEKLFPNYYRAIPLHRTFFTDPAHDEQQLHLKVLMHRVPVPSFQLPGSERGSVGVSQASYSMAIGPVFRRLVNFFTTSADLFMVLTFSGNIWESYVLPLVHQIIGETLTFDSLVATEDMLLKHCLLNQVLCISSLAYSKVPSVEISADERDFYLRLSIRLRNLAYKQLSSIVDEPTKIAAGSWGPERDAPYKEMLLLALMLQIRLDNSFGIFDNFNRYFERCEGLVGGAYNTGHGSVLDQPLGIRSVSGQTRPVSGPHAGIANKELLMLYRTMMIFFESTRAVDSHFQIDDRNLYQDITPQYNMLRDVYEALVDNSGSGVLEERDFIRIDKGESRDKRVASTEERVRTMDKSRTESRMGIGHDSPTQTGLDRPAKPLSKPFRSVLDRSKPYTLPDVSKVTHSSYTPSIAVSFTHTSSDADSDSDSDSGYPQVIISLDQSHSSTSKTIITVIRDTAKPQLVEIPAEYGKIPPTVDGEPAVNLMYGIPASLMVLLSRITNVANHRYTFDRRRVFPRNFPKICADMEDELFNWKLNWRLYDSVYDPKTDQREKKFISGFHKAIYHNIVSFYHGLVVFFSRLIKDTPPRLLQDHVMACLDNMEMLRELESETCHLQPLFWQYFICGCDATDPEIQDRYSSWFKNYDMLTNHWRAKQVMFEVWQRRGEGDENICWIDIVKDWNWVLFFG